MGEFFSFRREKELTRSEATIIIALRVNIRHIPRLNIGLDVS